ncbi:MAG: 50S ribosomal protein L18Ae [Candidatus Bathyarchaeia archaeon]
MSEAKTFKIRGEIRKSNLFEPIKFSKIIEAVKKEHALEKMYADIGSRHRAKRCNIKILCVDEA